VSAEFSKELTTSVIWLNERGLDIECVRIKPYSDNGRILADIQQIIPLPEAEDYRVRLKEKQQRERASRKRTYDYTRYTVTVGDKVHGDLPKRTAAFTLVRYLVGKGHSPESIAEAVPFRQNTMFRRVDGEVDVVTFFQKASADAANGGRTFDDKRFYTGESDLLHFEGNTYAFINQWGRRTSEAMDLIIEAFADESISYEVSE